MNSFKRKTGIMLITVALLTAVTFCLGFGQNMNNLNSGRLLVACATEATDSDTVTTGSSDGQQSGDSQESDNVQTVDESSEEQKKASVEEQKKSQSTFFKWGIPITCVLSLVLAVILAVRKANKKFGKEWD